MFGYVYHKGCLAAIKINACNRADADGPRLNSFLNAQEKPARLGGASFKGCRHLK